MLRNPLAKIKSLIEAKEWAESLRAAGKKLVMTNGVFDLLHRGHMEYLYQARREGDALIVAVNSDRSVKELKGPDRPVVTLKDRMYMLASLECVDAVVSFDGARALDVFETVPCDVYVKGGDYSEETLDRGEYALLKTNDPRFVFIPLVGSFSTTNTIKSIKTPEK